MKKWTRLSKIFMILSAAAVAVCAIHVAVEYAIMLNSDSSAPAEVAFLYAVPYAVGLCVLWTVWAGIMIFRRRKRNKRAEGEKE